ncbi:putative SAM-dependent methyltransferase [Herpetosiphon giganteus]|nr:putative SAM-dependent methyltransferase [Herpetosiphon giganteus]
MKTPDVSRWDGRVAKRLFVYRGSMVGDWNREEREGREGGLIERG